MKTFLKTSLALATSFLLIGCATTVQHLAAVEAQKIAVSPEGSKIIAQTTDKVIQQGLNAGATAIDTGNPYLHAVADAIRSNPDGIVDPANVQKIFKDYGDPANQSKFRTLGKDFLSLTKDAIKRFGRANAAELLATAIQKAASSPETNSP